MQLIDVNVLVYAADDSAPDHKRYADWVTELLNEPAPFAVSELVLSAVVRIVAHPKIFARPATIESAFEFVEDIHSHPRCVVVQPGRRHWAIFTDLCRRVSARGNLVPDAYLAALAIESGSEWITTDRDFSRFPGLRWRLPFDQ